jgi:hypothetical protein
MARWIEVLGYLFVTDTLEYMGSAFRILVSTTNKKIAGFLSDE